MASATNRDEIDIVSFPEDAHNSMMSFGESQPHWGSVPVIWSGSGDIVPLQKYLYYPFMPVLSSQTERRLAKPRICRIGVNILPF